MEHKVNYRKIGTIIIVVVLALVIAVALFVSHPWMRQSGGYIMDTGWAVEQQHYENVTSIGTFAQITAPGPSGFVLTGTSANGSLLVIRTRFSIASGVLWQKTFENGSGKAIEKAEDGGFLIAGVKYSDDASVSSENSSWLIKINSEGNLLWSKVYEGIGFNAITNASDGGYVMLGRFNVSGFDLPGLLKVDSEGNQQWMKTYSSSEADVLMALYALIPTRDGGYAMAGELQYTIYDVVYRNGWFVKTDVNGDSLVNRPFALNGACVLNSVVQASDGGFLLVGGTADSANDTYSACLLRTDWDGHMQWGRINATLANEGNEAGFEYYSTALLKNGTLVVAGYLNGFGATIEVINATGATDNYLINRDVGYVNYIMAVAPDGYAFAGYKSGSMWLLEDYYYEMSIPVPAAVLT